MKKLSLIAHTISLTFWLVVAPKALAQDQTSDAQLTAETEPEVSQRIIVQTDTEENIDNFSLNCYELPNVLGAIDENDRVTTTYSTNENGEVLVAPGSEKNVHYYCEAAQPLTTDGCWYFPNQTTRFQFVEDKENLPIYLVGVAAYETCDTDIDTTNPESIAALLPSGTPAPLMNGNVAAPIRATSEPVLENPDGSLEEEISIWEWIVVTIKEAFGLSE